MGEYHRYRWRGVIRAITVAAVAGIVAACASDNQSPAPVFLNGTGSDAGGVVAGMAPPAPAAVPRASRTVTVRPGQSLGRIAETYHVPSRTIIAANHLSPPYKVEIGQRLVIPGAAGGAPMMASGGPPMTVSSAPLPPPLMSAPPMASPTMPPVAAASSPPGRSPDVIPLDGPPSATPPPAAPPRTATLTPPAAAGPASAGPRETSAAAEARAESAPAAGGAAAPSGGATLPHGGHFAWPVRGHVLAGYGVATGGAHNDGINIAAPRGAPIAAVDGGVVAYAGNELRGYGNLVLVKHPDGWITAYAHCDELLVKRGDKVSRGQVIAKVGATGGVTEPQLHFELRRGKQAVDPREFLTPAPSAGGGESAKAG